MSNVYTLRDLKIKLFLLGLDDESVKILLDDVEYLESLAYQDGYDVAIKEIEEDNQ